MVERSNNGKTFPSARHRFLSKMVYVIGTVPVQRPFWIITAHTLHHVEDVCLLFSILDYNRGLKKMPLHSCLWSFLRVVLLIAALLLQQSFWMYKHIHDSACPHPNIPSRPWPEYTNHMHNYGLATEYQPIGNKDGDVTQFRHVAKLTLLCCHL